MWRMNNRGNLILGVILVAGTTLTSGCGMLKMPDMMQQTVDGMAKTNDGMAKTVAGMAKTNDMMGNMCAGQGKLTTSDYRDKLLDQIDKEPDIGAKLSLAVKYHYAWEFQGMSMACGRSDAYLQEVYNESIREFLESMHRYIATRSNASATSRNNSMNTLYALAATMHYTNSLQEKDAALFGYKPVSMLSLFNDVVTDTAAIDQGTLSSFNLPDYVDSGRILIGDVTYMLRLRYNFLTAFSFGLATTNYDGDEATLLGLAKYILDGALHRSWSPDFANKNTSQIMYYGTIMQRALDARDMLNVLGVSPKTDKTIYKVYRALNFDSFNTTPSKDDPKPLAEKKIAVKHMEDLVNKYLNAKDLTASDLE